MKSSSSTKRKTAIRPSSPGSFEFDPIDAPKPPKPWTPHEYQEWAVKLVVSNPAAGLLLDPGLGKTTSVLAAFMLLKKKGIVDRMLVIAPMRVMTDVWPAEVAKWTDFSHMKVAVLHGAKKADALRSDADVYVINPEGLQWLAAQKWKWPEMLVLDESTKFKHTRTQRFKTLRTLLNKFDRRYILTGSPAPNGLLDLFGQIYILDFGVALGKFITHFRNEYFFQTGFGGYTWKPKADAEEKIYQRIKPMVLRLDAADYQKLPPLIETTIAVDLPADAARRYAQLEDEFVLRLDSGEVTVQNFGAISTKLRQVANGAVYLDWSPHEEDWLGDSVDTAKVARWERIHDAKLTALADLYEELSGQPLLVAYQFQHDVARMQEWFGPGLPVIGGGTSRKKGSEAIAAWNRGDVPMMLIHAASGAHGLNLQDGGCNLAWFGGTYNLEHHEQLIRRLWRQGQTKPTKVYYLVTRRTVDAEVMAAVARKERDQRVLLEALKTSIRLRRGKKK